MLSFDEHPGIISFLAGIVVLVMGAVGLSLVIDRRLKTSSGVVRIESELAQGDVELEGLIDLRDERSRLLVDLTPKQQAGSATSEATFRRLETLRQRHASLVIIEEQLRGAVAKLEGDFLAYRESYRRRIWVDAIGEQLGDLMLRDGREYRQASISRVTDVGLEIRHSDGIARIQAPDLDPALQGRFQWNDEKRRQMMKRELENQEREVITEVPPPPLPKVKSHSRTFTPEDLDNLKTLRRLVSSWQSKVDQLTLDKLDVESHSAYGNQASIPGSLETWDAKITRLGNELIKARGELASAKARLAAFSLDQ